MAHANGETYDSGAGFGALGMNHTSSISPTRSKRSLSKSRSPKQRSDSKPANIGERVSKLESVVKSMHGGGLSSNVKHY